MSIFEDIDSGPNSCRTPPVVRWAVGVALKRQPEPLESLEDAEAFITERGLAVHILKHRNYHAAVCPTCPDGFYPDAVLVRPRDNSKGELNGTNNMPGINSASNCCRITRKHFKVVVPSAGIEPA
jgi:hypothetical protein